MHLLMQKESDKAGLNLEDGGASNFDSVIVDFGKHSYVDDIIASLAVELGVFIYKITSGIYRGMYNCDLGFKGQGARRTRMAKAAQMSLKENGFKAYMYYELD